MSPSIEIFFKGVVRVPQNGAMKFTALSAALPKVLFAEEPEAAGVGAGTTDAEPDLAASYNRLAKLAGRAA